MAKNETTPLIHCDACGKDYSPAYRRCPVCGNRPDAVRARNEERAASSEPRGARRPVEDANGGRSASGSRSAGSAGGSRNSARTYGQVPQARGATPSRRAARPQRSAFWAFWDRVGISPVRVIGFVFTLLIILALFLIVTKLVLPAIGRGSVNTPDNKRPDQSQSDSPSASESPSASPSASQNPVIVDPKPTNTIPLDQTAVDFDISLKEFAISVKWPNPVQLEVTLYPAGSKGTVTFTSSDPSIIGVNADGVVWAEGKGTAIVTATMPGAEPKTCKVYSSVAGGPKPDNTTTTATPSTAPSAAPSTAPSTAPTGTLRMSIPEFTISDQYPAPVTVTVSGASGTVTWNSSNPGVASVDQKGKVTRIGKGKCTITATDATGNYGECIVRCS